LRKTFFALDDKVSKEDFAQDTGSTSCVIFFTNNKMYCANAGDSRAVLSCGNEVAGLSEDHKPDNAEEL
jgi:protein phosphatase 2C family protein 2/3